jgi:hypothetical protein
LLFGFRWLAIAVLAYSVIQYIFIVAFEEEVLVQTFGDAYRRYCEQVPRWIPRLVPAPASDHYFCLLRGLKSEKSTFFSIAGITALYFLKQSFS